MSVSEQRRMTEHTKIVVLFFIAWTTFSCEGVFSNATGGQAKAGKAGMPSLLGKLAIRLATKSVASAASQSSVQSPQVAPVQSPQVVAQGYPVQVQVSRPQYPQSEWSGLLDVPQQLQPQQLQPQPQQQQVGQQNWPQYQSQQFPQQQQQPYQQQQYQQQQQPQLPQQQPQVPQQQPQLPQQQPQLPQQPIQQHQPYQPHYPPPLQQQPQQMNAQVYQNQQYQGPQYQVQSPNQQPQQMQAPQMMNPQWQAQNPLSQAIPPQNSQWQGAYGQQMQPPGLLAAPSATLTQPQPNQQSPQTPPKAHQAPAPTAAPPAPAHPEVTTAAVPVDPWVYDKFNASGSNVSTELPPPAPVVHKVTPVPVKAPSHARAAPSPPQQTQTQYRPPAPQPIQPVFSNYYQPLTQQQPQYSQNHWQPPPAPAGQGAAGAFGGQQPPPPVQQTDPFSTNFQVNGLKPTIFNPQYQNAPQNPQGSPGQGRPSFSAPLNEYGLPFGSQNPNFQGGKADFTSKGPNPIQLNQFLAQPATVKETNALSANLDAILGSLLGTNSQPKTTTTTTTTAPEPIKQHAVLVSDRLNGFILGPKSEYRSNVFNEIPVNNIAYDNLNPLAAFMGETPPPPATTTPAPPGRNGDFLEGFMGVNNVTPKPKPHTDYLPQNVYLYNHMNESPPVTKPAPTPAPSNDQVLNNLGTQDISAIVSKLLGVLATKQQG